VCLLAKVLPSYTLLAAALLIFIQVAKFFSVSLAISGLLDRVTRHTVMSHKSVIIVKVNIVVRRALNNAEVTDIVKNNWVPVKATG
jgi:hypothetical protein